VKTLISTLGVLLLASTAFAQTDRGTITGTVLDPAGAVVPGATIEAKNTATSQTYNAGSTGTGNYTLASLPAGTYELSVNATGFKKYVRPGITVQVAETTRVDATLEVGATSDTVTVNAEAPLLKTESGELSHQIDFTQADEIPIFTLNGSNNEGLGNIRDPLSVLTTLPGADFSSDFEVRINGLPSGTQAIRVEGQDATNGFMIYGNQAVQQSVDAIQEVSVQTSNFAAEYGQVGGGYINYTMKSGTNQLHGSAYDYFNNEALNAGLPFTDNPVTGVGHVRNPLRRNDYGFTLGGPVRIPKIYNGKDKTFFFFSFEQFRQGNVTNNLFGTAPMPQWTGGSNPACGTPSAPTALGSSGSCDAYFGPYLADGKTTNPGNITNPFGPFPVAIGAGPANNFAGTPSPAGSVDYYGQLFDQTTAKFVNGGPLGSGIVETPFQGGIIPFSRMDPAVLKYQSFFITPNVLGPGGVPGLNNNNLAPPYSNYRHTTIPSIKIDQNLSSKMKVSGYYNQTRTYSPNSTGYSNLEAPATPQNQVSQTVRANFDDTLTPTLLLHVGIGLLAFDQNQYPPSVGSAGSLLGWSPGQTYPDNRFMPNIAGLSSFFSGGLAVGGIFGGPGPGFAADQNEWEYKPTANVNMTWVKGNHTFKWGGELVVDGFPTVSSSRANALYGFGNAETQNPWEYTSNAPGLGSGAFLTSGFGYASWLLGTVDNLNASAITDTRLGRHELGFFAQDNWKVTRKLTLELGLRYDYSNLLQEEHGRMQSANFQMPNPSLVPADSTTPLNGLVMYQKQFNQNYPFAFGPRVGLAYQINSKTVFRAGAGVAYSVAGTNAGLSGTDADFYALGAPAGTGQGIGGSCAGANPSCIRFQDGNPFGPGNRFGNGPLTAPLNGATAPGSATAAFPSQTSSSGCGVAPLFASPCRPVDSPFITIDKGTGRPPRIFNWSIGLQREIMPNLIIEANYVGNRGAWFTAPDLSAEAENGLTPAGLLASRAYGNTTGINIHNQGVPGSSCVGGCPASLLTLPISDPNVIAAFPALANPNNVYPGFPSYNFLNQALRPVPQWIGVPPFLGPPLADTWYDSLQVKLTKRYSRGLTVTGAYTYQKAESLGANSNSAYFTAGSVVVNDVYNRQQNKQLSSLDEPQVLVVNFNYTTQKNKFGGDGFAGKTLQWLSRDWTFGGVLRYQSGVLLETPSSQNNLLYQLGIGSQDNPAVFGAPFSVENYVPGQPFFAPGFNPNSHFDPTKTLVLNTKAWVDAPPGTYGVSAPYYINNRWQRQPAESLSVGRIFRIKEKYQLQLRGEFYNVFNRVFYTAPASGGGAFAPTGTFTAPTYANSFPVLGSTSGALNGGFGFVNSFNGFGTQPRSGQLIARFTF